MLHVTNGDVAARLIEQVVEGEVLPWRDVLHEGPVPHVDDLARVRARFLADHWTDEESAYASLRETEDRVSGAEHVVLWFEHDLFDQLLLVQALTQARGRVELALSDTYLNEADLAALWEARTEATGEQRAAASAFWDAFRGDDPRRLESLDTSALPHLGAATQRLLAELPSTWEGLGRTEEQIVTAVAEGARTFHDLFAATQRHEEPRFMGDAAFALHVERLRPLIGEEPYTPAAPFGDFVKEFGVDRWLGGVHLEGTGPVWRWDGSQVVRA